MTIQVLKKNSLQNLEHSQYAINLHTICTEANIEKINSLLPVARLAELGFTIYATAGTAQVLRRNGIPATSVRKVSEGVSERGEMTIVGLIESGAIDMVVNTPKGQGARADGYSIREATTSADKPIITTVQELQAAVQALEAQLRVRNQIVR